MGCSLSFFPSPVTTTGLFLLLYVDIVSQVPDLPKGFDFIVKKERKKEREREDMTEIQIGTRK
jgi:hypothetical protein